MNKKSFLTILLSLIVGLNLSAQVAKVKTDEFIELLNTVWILSNGCSDTAVYNAVYNNFGNYANHSVVKLFKADNANSAINYSHNFQYAVLPYFALKLSEDKNGKICFDEKGFENDCLLSPFWKKNSIKQIVSDLSDFRRVSDFKSYYDNNLKFNQAQEVVYNLTAKTIDAEVVGEIFGRKINSVSFYQVKTRPQFDLGVPFVSVDGEIMPVFSCLSDEMLNPSYIIPGEFVRQQLPKYNLVLGLMTALVVDEFGDVDGDLKDVCSKCSESLLHLYDVKVNEFDVDDKNLVSKWFPLVLMNDYSKNAKTSGCATDFIRKAYEMGFVWHLDALDFMRNYYENRSVYVRLKDFLPQLVGYMSLLATTSNEIKAEYDFCHSPFIKSVFPAEGTVLDMSNDSIVITIHFSQEILNLKSVTINSLRKTKDNKSYSYSMIAPETLSFRISTKEARNIGFYGISIASDSVTNVLGNNMVRDFSVKYYLP